MKIIHRYIGGQLVTSFLISLVVFTFVLFVGNVIRLMDLLERGVSGDLLFRLFLSFIPYLLSFSIPMSILTATLLVFGRLSADNEVSAMRACGLSMYTIFKSGFVVALILTALCFVINTSLSPRAHYMMRKLKYQVGQKSPEALLEAGVFIDYFRPYQFYIGEKHGNKFKDVIVYEQMDDGRTRFLTADSGEIGKDVNGQVIFKIYDGTMEQPPKEGETASISGSFKTYVVPMEMGDESEDVPKKLKDYTLRELMKRHRRFKRMHRGASPRQKRDLERRISVVRTRMSEYFVYTFCPLAFVMIGMPLGVTAHRGETSIGGAISLALVALNYAGIICFEAFQAQPEIHSYILIWIPNLLFMILGPILMYRIERR